MQSEKSALRQKMRDRLATLAPDVRRAASEVLAERIAGSEIWKKASIIGLFAGRDDEMDTEILWPLAGNKTICYPKVEADDLHFFPVKSPSLLLRGAWNLLEPSGSLAEKPDLVLVPGLAFDARGGRLGRGKGFYDRWLAQNPQAATLGVCFACQMLETVPLDEHDIGMDCVITEIGVYLAG